MRILHLVHGRPPRHRGGTESYVERIARAQIDEGHHVGVLAGSDEEVSGELLESSRERSLELFTLRRRGLYLDSWQAMLDPEAEAGVLRATREFGPDVVHVHHWRRLASGVVRRLRIAGYPVVLSLHDLSSTCPRYIRVREESYCERPLAPASCRNCVERFWYQGDGEIDARIRLYADEMAAELEAASRIISPSAELRDEILRLRPELEVEPVVLPHALVAEGTRAAPRGEDARLAFWGSLQPAKGAHLLLAALRRMKRRDWQLDLWGDLEAAEPAYRARLEHAARGLPVHFRGVFRPDEIPGYYDLAVFPSIAFESYSLTVDEAFARGIPVLVSDRGAPSGRIGEGGRSFRAEDVRDLARVLDELVGDQELLDELRRKLPRLLTMPEYMVALESLYAEAQTTGSDPAVPPIDVSARGSVQQGALRARERELWRMRGRVDQERDRAEGMKGEIEQREETIEKQEEVLADFSKNLAELTALLRQRESDLAARGEELESVRADLAGHEAELRGRDARLAEFERSCSDFERSLGRSEEERERLEEEIKALQDRIDREAKSARETIASFEDSLAAERRMRMDAERGLDVGAEERQKLAEHAQRVAELRESEAGERRAEIERLQTAHEQELARLRGEQEHLRRERDEAVVGRMQAHRRELAELRTEQSEATRRLEERLALREGELEDARATFDAEISALETRLEAATTGRERLRVMAENLREELEAERESLRLTNDALERALREIEDLRDSAQRLAGLMVERLAPVLGEAAGEKLDDQPAEALIEAALANHYRLHELIGQRDELLQELVLRVDEYERRLNPQHQPGPAAGPDSITRSFKRRIGKLKRRVQRRREGDRMRILMVVHDFLPKHNAGTEIYTYNLAKELSARHDVHLLFCEARHEQERYTVSEGSYDGLPFTEVVHNYQWESFEETYRDPRMEEIFSGVLDDFEPDLVHIQHLHYFSIGFIDIAKARDLPIVYTLHEFMLLCARGGQLLREDMEICEQPVPEKCADCIRHHHLARDYGLDESQRAKQRVADLLPGSLQRAFEGFAGPIRPAQLDEATRGVYARAAARRLEVIGAALSKVDLFISPSGFLRQKFIDSGMVRPDQIIHSDNGFDVSPFSGFERQPSETLRFGFVGTIAEYKGIHVMVEAMNGIRDAGVELQIWGDIETFQDYKQRLLGLLDNPAIKLMGRFRNDRIAEVLSGIDVLIVPSLWFENSPLTIHEAWLARMPVLASDRGGMAELVDDGVNGFHFRLGDPLDLREKMRRFIADRSLIEKMGDQPGPVKLIADNAREIEGIYQSLIGSAVK